MTIPLQFGLCVLIWGSTWLAITTQIDVIAPAWSVAYRFALAAVLLHFMVFATPARRRVELRQHLGFLGYGISQFCLNYLFVYEAERHVASGLVAVVFALMVVINPLMARLFLGERSSRLVWAGGIVATGGVALLYIKDIGALDLSAGALKGLLLAVAGTVAACIGNVFAAKTGRNISAITLNSWAMSYGALGAAAYAWFSAGPPAAPQTGLYWAGLAYLAVFGSVVAFTLYLNVIQKWGITRAGYTSVLIPIVALALSTIYEGYVWTPEAVVGAALVMAGTMMALRARARGRR